MTLCGRPTSLRGQQAGTVRSAHTSPTEGVGEVRFCTVGNEQLLPRKNDVRSL